VSFRKALWGYDIESVEQALAEKRREMEESDPEVFVDHEEKQLEQLLESFRDQVKMAEERRSLIQRTKLYAHDFPEYLKDKAAEKAQIILAEAEKFTSDKEADGLFIGQKIMELQKTLSLVKQEAGRILSALPLEKMVDGNKQVNDEMIREYRALEEKSDVEYIPTQDHSVKESKDKPSPFTIAHPNLFRMEDD